MVNNDTNRVAETTSPIVPVAITDIKAVTGISVLFLFLYLTLSYLSKDLVSYDSAIELNHIYSTVLSPYIRHSAHIQHFKSNSTSFK